MRIFQPIISGSIDVSGSLTVNNGITGSLYGTSSWAVTASYVENAQTASYVLNAINAVTASYILNAVSSSYSATASYYQETDPIFVAKSGSLATTGSNQFKATQAVTGALAIYPSHDTGAGDVIASYIFVTASADNTENNLQYRNNGALWEMHWLEERADTGLVWGGVVTYSGSTIYVSPGAGLIVNHNASTSSHGDTVPSYIGFGPITASAQFITSSQLTYLLIDSNGSLIQQTTTYTPQQYNEKFPLGYITHLTTSSISAYADARVTTYGQSEQAAQFVRAFGPLKISGYDITAQSGSLKISIASGRTFRYGGFYSQDPDNPSIYDSSAVATGSIIRLYRDPEVIGGYKALTNGGLPYTDIDPTLWDDGSGVLSFVGSSEWTVQRVYQGVVNGLSYVYYGQNVYNSLAEAIQNITTEAFQESSATVISLPFIGYIITRGNTTSLTDTTNNKIINSGLFRNTAGASGGGGTTTTNLSDLTDVTISSPQTGQALVYNAGIWQNGTPLNATNSTSASYAATASYVVNSISASYAVTASYVATASYAATASYVPFNYGLAYAISSLNYLT